MYLDVAYWREILARDPCHMWCESWCTIALWYIDVGSVAQMLMWIFCAVWHKYVWIWTCNMIIVACNSDSQSVAHIYPLCWIMMWGILMWTVDVKPWQRLISDVQSWCGSRCKSESWRGILIWNLQTTSVAKTLSRCHLDVVSPDTSPNS